MKHFTQYTVISALFIGLFFSVAPDAEAATALRYKAMASAKTQKNARYVWAAEGGYSRGYDCSGLVYWAYKKNGKTLPRTAQAQYNKSKHISAASRKPGDLIFIKDRYGRVYHVGFFTGVKNGKGRMIDANSGNYYGKKVLVDEWVTNHTNGSPYAVYGRF